MNKRYLLAGGLLVLGVTTAICGLTACKNGKPPKEEIPTPTDSVRYTEKTNPYAELGWDEYKGIDDWAAKLTDEDGIYYQFEGSYAEGYQGDYSRTYMYMDCYKDGSLRGTIYGHNAENGTDVYGYWTNITNRNKESLVLHVITYGNEAYTGPEVVCNDQNGVYDFNSNFSYNTGWAYRAMPIVGYRYSPIKDLTVETSAISGGCIIGESMSYDGLVVNVNRENGKSMTIDKDSYTQPSCRVKFSGFDSAEAGESEVTVSYVNTDISTTYTVNVMGVKSISVDTSNAVTSYKVSDALDKNGLVVNATRDDDVVVELDINRCKFETPNWGTVGTKTVKVTFGEGESARTDTYEVEMSAIEVTGTINGKDVTLNMTTSTDCTYTYDGTAYNLKYKGVWLQDYPSEHNGLVYHFIKPTNDSIPEEVWKTLDVCFILDTDNNEIIKHNKVYEIPSTDENYENLPNNERLDNEVIVSWKDNAWGTEKRYITIDEEKNTATITYLYWYHGTRDTFVCEYTIDENGVLTLTSGERTEGGGAGANFNGIFHVWHLNDDYTATRVNEAS